MRALDATYRPRRREPLAVNEATADRWISVAEAASELGLPERAIYRRIATQAMRARRDDSGGLLVCVDEGATADLEPPSARLAVQGDRGLSLTPDKARALTEFATGLVDPLMSRLSEQEAIIRQQAEELGRLRARDDVARETNERLAPAFTRQLAELAAIREEIEKLGGRRRWWPFG